MKDVATWLDTPAVQPGGTLAVEMKAALEPFDIVPGRLVAGESGVHRYVLAGSPGVTLQAKVATDAFDPVVVVIAPSGARRDLSSLARRPDAGRGGDLAAPHEDLVLAERGEHVLVVSSRENVAAGRALTTGEYRLTLLCDEPKKAPTAVPSAAPSSRSGRFGAWESEPR